MVTGVRAAIAGVARAATVIVDPAVTAADATVAPAMIAARAVVRDRGPRREREGGDRDSGPAPEFAPAFLTGDDND